VPPSLFWIVAAGVGLWITLSKRAAQTPAGKHAAIMPKRPRLLTALGVALYLLGAFIALTAILVFSQIPDLNRQGLALPRDVFVSFLRQMALGIGFVICGIAFIRRWSGWRILACILGALGITAAMAALVQGGGASNIIAGVTGILSLIMGVLLLFAAGRKPVPSAPQTAQTPHTSNG
jgi:hypothetical protein